MNDGFANVSESENSDLGLCCQNRSTRQKKSPTTVHNRKSLPFFRIWGHDFLKRRSPTQHGKTCKPQKGQSPIRENMPSQKGQGLTQQDKRPRKRPVLNPRRHASFRKTQSSPKDTFAPKRAMRVRGSMRLKKRCTIHHTNQKMGGDWHRCLYKTHFVFHRPDLRKIGDDCSIEIGRQPAPASKTKYLPSEPRYPHLE